MIMRVVIIDDEEWTRDTIKRIGKWRDLGFKIAGEASDGASGLECIRQVKPHLIITDMKMPGIDGARMLQMLDAEKQQEAKVIVISGYSDYVYTRQALTSQAFDYLLKPVDADEFNRILTKCAHAIREQQRIEKPQSPQFLLQGVDSAWMKRYQESRDDVRNSLDALSLQGIGFAFQSIIDLCSRTEERWKLSIMVKINQDLQSIVHEVMVSWAVEDDSKFSPITISFAIGSQRTIKDMIEHFTHIMGDLIEYKMRENQKKQRLDIETIRAYIDAHFAENITLEALAHNYSVSKEYLSSLFKKETGSTFTEYITKLRMLKAKELIVHHRIPLQRVPELVGYMDVPHFYKAFKRFFGYTPGFLRDGKND